MIGHTGSFLTPDLVSTHDIKLLLTMMVPAFEQSKNKQDRRSRNPTCNILGRDFFSPLFQQLIEHTRACWLS